MDGLTRKIEALSPEQLQALADRLLAMRPKGGDQDQEAKRPAQLPLSFSQQGLWSLEKLGAGSPYYECFPLRLTGALHREALAHSLSEVVRRHEALRTSFVVVGDQPCQVVSPPGDVDLRSLDLSELSAEKKELEAHRHIEAQATQPFDLEKGPLYRASLIKISEREHILCWIVHHLVWDGWSMWLFLGEVTARYAAIVNGQPFALPPLRLQYADYALRQRRRLPAGVPELVKYWRRQLEGAPPTLDLPTDRPRQSVASLKGAARVKISLDADLVHGLQALARQEGVTLYMLTLAAFKAVISRWADVGDVVVGTPVAGRNARGAEELIGYFSNVLVMRTDTSGDPTFRNLLQRVKTTAVDAFAHQDLPFGTLVSELRPKRLLGRNPLFQVLFALHDFHGEVSPDVTGDLQVSVMHLGDFAPKFELELQLAKEPSGMSAWFSYQTALFERDTIERWMTHYQNVLRAIVADPNIRVSRIPIVADAERKRLLEQLQSPTTPQPDELAHELFEEQVRRTPEATALVCGDHAWTFAELNRRANRLAHCLIGRGVGPDVPVGVLSPSAMDAMLGLLAVLKAGGAYLPLVLNDSPEALSDVVDRAAPRVVLVRGYSMSCLPSSVRDIIWLECDGDDSGEMPDVNPGRRGLAEHHLAYVTSPVTSSGERKHVMVEHRGVANVAQWVRTHFPSDRFPQTAFSVRPDLDWSVIDSLAWLASGSTVHVLAPPLNTNERIPDVAVLCGTPLALERLVDAGRLGKVRAVLARGGRLSRRLVDKLFSTTAVQRITYLFGYSETTNYSTYLHIDGPADPERRIGRPLANARVYFLDAAGQPTPIGVYGELCIGGVGVARGYLNDLEATRERFAPDPFDAEHGGRLFRTRRNGRWLEDGSIELQSPLEKLAPSDSRRTQVQEELDNWKSIRDAAVAHAPVDSRLVVYVAPDATRAATRRETERLRWEARHVAAWGKRSKEIYGSGFSTPVEPGFDITGWVSRNNELPFNPAELREAVDETICRIKRLAPRRVLEVGCGTGLLLHGVAPACESYVATDASADAIERLQSQLAESSRSCDIELYEIAAREIGQLAIGPRDTVVLDFVVQCFPSVEYLLDVLALAVDHVVPGGTIFVGGVRHLSLLKAFHASAQLNRASDFMSIAEFRARVRERMAQEPELALSPELFVEFGRRNRRISDVQVHLRRGCYDNELTQFHYDVVLRVGDEPQPINSISLQGRDPELAKSIVELLRADRPSRVVVRGIPNARLTRPLAVQRLLDAPPPELRSVADLRRLAEADTGHAVHPELLWNMGERLQYDVRLDWSAAREDGSFDAVFSRPEVA